MLLSLHVLAGGLALVLGALALMARKGATLHRRSGLLFVAAMLAMGISGSLVAAGQSLTNANVLGGLMSTYFVLTAFTSVQPSARWIDRLNGASMLVGAALALTWFSLGLRGLANPHRTVPDEVVYSTFVFGAIMTLAIAGDVRIMRSGPLRGGRRLARHLWRMCIGFVIAIASFVAIPERVATILPAPFTTPLMRALPVVLVFLTMFYWLWRVRRRGVEAHAAAPARSPAAV